MPDDTAGRRPQGFFTRLSHAGRAGTHAHGFVNPPLVRGSTVLYPSCADRIAMGKRRLDQALTYGTHGGPTHFALEDMIAEIEGGTRCQIVSTGLAAITTLRLWPGAHLRGRHARAPGRGDPLLSARDRCVGD
jgi:cystathionine beta-lyase